MDLQDQLKNLFPDHVSEETEPAQEIKPDFWIQDQELICKYEKRKGKPTTIIEGYNGTNKDFKALTSLIQKQFHVGGSFKKETIVIQGDYRDKIMDLLKSYGFKVKRVGG